MPAFKTNMTIQPPVAGVNRRVGYQNQPPFSSYESINFWPIDARTSRTLTATRPNLDPFTSPGSSGTVNFINRVNGVKTGDPFNSMVSARDGDLYWWNGSTWQAATGTHADQVDTGYPVFGATFLQKTYIHQADDKPIVFDYPTGAATELVETAGTIPNDLRMFGVFQGCLLGAGRLDAPHLLYMSKTGDATNWDFAAPITDAGGAFATAGEDEGLLRGPITAIMPHTNDACVISTLEGLAVLHGHPRRGGIFRSLEGIEYTLGQGAWCIDPEENLWYLTVSGLMRMQPFQNTFPTPVSAGKIPDELVGLAYDYENPTVSLAYDTRWDGIHITVRDDTNPQAWFYHRPTGSFHQMEFDSYPWRLMEFPGLVTETTNGLLYAGEDGLSRMDRVGSTPFDSRIKIGPIRISPDAHKKAIIQRAVVTLTDESSAVSGDVKFAGGADGEDAINRLVDEKSQFSASLYHLSLNNHVLYPRVSGHAAAIELRVFGGYAGLEEITLALGQAGINRITRLKNTTNKTTCFGYATATPSFAPEASVSETGITIPDSNFWNADIAGVTSLLDFELTAVAESDADGFRDSFTISITDDSTESVTLDTAAKTLTIVMDITGGNDTIGDLDTLITASGLFTMDNYGSASAGVGETVGQGTLSEAQIRIVGTNVGTSLNGTEARIEEDSSVGSPVAQVNSSGDLVVSVPDASSSTLANVVTAISGVTGYSASITMANNSSNYVPGILPSPTGEFEGGADAGSSDGIEIINLADLPDEWWSLTNDTGSNIRVTGTDNRFYPIDVFAFDKTNQTGAMVVRRPLPATPVPIRIWCCSVDLAKFPKGHRFGQFYSYPPWMITYWPNNVGRSRTSLEIDRPNPDPDTYSENPFLSPPPPAPPPSQKCRTISDRDDVATVIGFVKIFDENPPPPDEICE